MGLKGTDDQKTIALSIAKNVAPKSQIRALEFIEGVKNLGKKGFRFYTCNLKMGEDYLINKGIDYSVVYEYRGNISTREDTYKSCQKMVENCVDVIFFVGGDGTARDIFSVVGNKIPLIGIPSGVKMYSGIFCVTLSSSIKMFADFLNGEYELGEAEIIDHNETDYRMDKFEPKIYGYALTLSKLDNIQGTKDGLSDNDWECQRRIVKYFLEKLLEEDTYYILGPGTTVKAILKELKQPYTLLGVDILYNRTVIAKDVNEEQILDIIKDQRAKIVVSPLGGQGIILGRGNQQISSKVLKKVGKGGLIVLATERKLASIKRGYLIADIDDAEVRKLFQGYIRVLVDYNIEKVLRLVC